jgi:hypothetical protein
MATISKELERGSKNNKWIDEHTSDLRSEYGGEYIAVEEGRVIAHSESQEEIIEKTQDNAKHPDSAIITFVYETGKKILR